MPFSEKAQILLDGLDVVGEAFGALSADLAALYRDLPEALARVPELSWLSREHGWQSHPTAGFVQLYRGTWPNQGQQGIHLELAHSPDSLLRGCVSLVLHVENAVCRHPRYWPLLGQQIVQSLKSTAPARASVATEVPPGEFVTLACMEIPLIANRERFLGELGRVLSGLKPVVDAVDAGLRRCTHTPFYSTRLGPEDPVPAFTWGEDDASGGQSLQASGARSGGRCIRISATASRFNHKRTKRSILPCGRFARRVHAGERLYQTLWLKCECDVRVKAQADGGGARSGDWVLAWDFGDHVVNTGGEWAQFEWTTEATTHPDFDVWSAGGSHYLLTDTGDGTLLIDELELGVLNPIEG